MTGPGVAGEGVINSTYLTVMDLAPTFIEIAGATYPDDGSVKPMLGESMVSFLAGESKTVHADDYVTLISHRGRSFVRQGQWKLVVVEGPFDEDKFELYDVLADPGETRDLRSSMPEIYSEMLETWRDERLKLGIILPKDL